MQVCSGNVHVSDCGSAHCNGALSMAFLLGRTLGAHAQEGYGTCVCVRVRVCTYVCVCVVCLFVRTPAPTSLVSTLKMRYVGVYLRLFNAWIFDKSFRSKVMARKSQYANEQLPLATGLIGEPT